MRLVVISALLAIVSAAPVDQWVEQPSSSSASLVQAQEKGKFPFGPGGFGQLWTYVGCYVDCVPNCNTRDFRYGPKQYGYDEKKCLDACGPYKYFALQNNGWCSCDNEYGGGAFVKRPDRECGSNLRGGGARNAVYMNNALAALGPWGPWGVQLNQEKKNRKVTTSLAQTKKKEAHVASLIQQLSEAKGWNDCVTLCTAPNIQQCAGGGNYISANLPPGKWSMGQLHIPNDSLKSVWMSGTCKVTFYEHANFGGYAKTITPDNAPGGFGTYDEAALHAAGIVTSGGSAVSSVKVEYNY